MTRQHSLDLDHLLAPLTRDDFVARYFERDFLHLARGDRGYYDGLLDLATMDRVVAHGELQPDYTVTLIQGDTAIHKLGSGGRQDFRGGHDLRSQSLENADVYRGVAAGGTLRISFTERYSESIAILVGELERQLDANVTTNAFLTPAGTHAFSRHHDAHDVFILQLEGHKHWEVLRPPAELPMEKPVRVRRELFARRLPFDGRASVGNAPGVEVTEIRLERGDLLYVPRGFSHSARAGDEPSLHLTVEVRAFTWHELFAHAVAQALPDLPVLRRALPPGFADGGNDVAAAVAAAQPQVLAAALAAIDEERLTTALGDLADRFVYTRTPQTAGRLTEASAPRGDEELVATSRLRVRPGLATRLRPVGETLRLFFSGEVVELPARCRSMLDAMLERRRFAVGEIPAPLGADSRRMLLRHLVRVGLLTADVNVDPSASSEPVALAHGA